MTGRRLILHMSMSLDGFVARSDGVIDWLGGEGGAIPDHGDQRHRMNLELLGQIDTIVLGRGAYEDMFRGWSGSDNPMARLMNTLPKVVFSQSLPVVEWNNARLTRRPLEEEIPELKREDGRDMVVFGGARIAHSLIRERLVDECRLTVHPVALGDGLSLMHGLPEPQRSSWSAARRTPMGASRRSCGRRDVSEAPRELLHDPGAQLVGHLQDVAVMAS